MFSQTFLLFTVTLAIIVVPASSDKEKSSLSIPFVKRNGLTTADGVFDRARAIKQIAYTQNKHRNNRINLERNAGSHAFSNAAEIKPVAPLPAANANAVNVKKRQGMPLTDQNSETLWTGQLSIGTPPQHFAVDIDTGSSDLWVVSSACTNSPCTSRHKFNPGSSTTAIHHKGNFEIEYGGGVSLSGPIYTDTVKAAGFAATGQYFSPLTLPSNFADTPMDGILGLAYPSLSRLPGMPFFNTLIAQGKGHTGEFGILLTQNFSELYFGGANIKYYSGEIEFHSVRPDAGYWQIPGAKAIVNGSPAYSGFDTIIDSGTTIMYAPPSDAKAFYSKVPGSALFDAKHGFYSFSCKSVPTVSFNWGGKDWDISSANFNLGMTKAGSTQCVGALVSSDPGTFIDTWLIGDSFMVNVYSVFSFEKNAVGFARLK